jgi:hypothetical protein
MVKWSVSVSVRLYSVLLSIYPQSFRREYGIELIILFRDMSREGIRQRGFFGILAVWLIVIPELWMTAREQHLLAGSYYLFRRLVNRVFIGFISFTAFISGFIYWLSLR